MRRSLMICLLILLATGGMLALMGAEETSPPGPPVKLGILEKLSGSGSQVGTMWRDGALLAIDELNAQGGLLGRPIVPVIRNLPWGMAEAAAVTRELLAEDPFAILGPVYTSLTLATAPIIQAAEIPQLTGSVSALITAKGFPHLIRASLTDVVAVQKGLHYALEELKMDRLALIYVQDAYGQGARDLIVRYLKGRGVSLLAEVPTQPQQLDYAQALEQVKKANAKALILVLFELEAALAVQELKKLGLEMEIIGGEPLCSPTTIGLGGKAMEGVRCHVSLTPDAPLAAIQDMVRRFQSRYGVKPDHNALKAYMAVYMLKAGLEKVKTLDRAKLLSCLKGLTLLVREEPGLLMDVAIKPNGDIERDSFFVEVKDGKEEVFRIVPPLTGPLPPKTCS
ncbi:MAG: ABC transporter substrate-binding protein [candidate division NC10 bacterium]|nr:ABC transporter substrate-binding protein [candidate division NC10 bacterium]